MADVKKVVVKKRRDEKEDLREFSFLDSPLRVSGVSEKVKRYRLQAYESYQTLPFPTHQDEPWRRTPLKGFKPGQFVLDADDGLPDQVDPLREAWQDVEVAGSVAVVNGSAVEIKLDPKLAEKGVIFTDLITAEDEYPEIVDRIIGEAVPAGESKFSSLSGAFSQNGIVLYVPEKLDIKIPFRALLWLSGEHRAVFSHVLVLLERSSSATFVLEYGSNYDGGQEQFHSGIVEILLEDAARLKFEEFQAYGKNVWNFSQERAVLGRDSDFVWNHGAFGSKLTKNFIDTKLMGEGANARMNGLYILDDYQHHDHDTQQNHLASYTTSDLLYKGAVLGQSRAVWQGMIYVSEGSQKIDGYQMNNNLVLNPDARADTIPGLEILADDVRCSHGATVGKIDQDQIFYLLSRGIPKDEAEKLIIEGFFTPVIQRITTENLRERITETVAQKLGAKQ